MLRISTNVAVALALFVLIGCVSNPINSDYRGPDAGTLIFSTSTLRGPMNFTFYYRRIGQALDIHEPAGAGTIDCSCVGFFHATMSDADYTGYETGKVTVQRLPPGDYEVYTFGFDGSIIVANIAWSPKKGFSIPFTIKPGKATYIGNFARSPSLGTPLESKFGAAGFFVISDKHERDIKIVRKREPDLPPVTISVTDVTQLGHPELLAKEPK